MPSRSSVIGSGTQNTYGQTANAPSAAQAAALAVQNF